MIALFEKISESSTVMTVLLFLQLISMYVMQQHIKAMEPYGGAPDVWFAYRPLQLGEWLANMSEEGCQTYIRMAQWDLFPYMECYTLLLGTLLLQQVRAAGLSDRIAMIFPAVMVMDVIETIVPVRWCGQENVSLNVLGLAAVANKYKWVLFGAGLGNLSILFLYNNFIAARTNDKGKESSAAAGEKKKE